MLRFKTADAPATARKDLLKVKLDMNFGATQFDVSDGQCSGFERPSQARFGGLTLVSRAPWLLVTGAPGLFSWPNTLWTTAVACLMSPTSRMAKAAASRRHRHRNSRGAAAARRWPPTQAWMLHDWLTVDLNEMLPAADLNIIIFETD